ncbi:hypothetical protein [Streptomyces agglomeratus]|uniref:hypothetical protein n=1 Tax=Streptomyces agglomeratus TaxID=285458 RepID=UPI000B2BCFEF|nr:hypothetical protein [Streptomyces agglomeratus]
MRYKQKALPPTPGKFANEKELAAFVLDKMAQWFHIEEQVKGRYWTGEKTRIDAVLRPQDPDPWFDENPAFGVEFKNLSANSSVSDRYGWVAQAVAYTHCEWDGYGSLAIFLCPSPLAWILSRAEDLAVARQKQISPEMLEKERQRVRDYGRRFGREYTDAYIEREALLAHRRRIGEFNYEDFTARADGYANADERQREHDLRVAIELTHLLGQLNVGELMPYEGDGWMLTRSGDRLWSEHRGVPGVPYSLRPRIGSQRR